MKESEFYNLTGKDKCSVKGAGDLGEILWIDFHSGRIGFNTKEVGMVHWGYQIVEVEVEGKEEE